MATYTELDTFMSSPDRAALATRVLSAIARKGAIIVNAPGGSSASKTWARGALENPSAYNNAIFRFVVYDSSSMTLPQIAALTDAEVQTKVDKAVDAIYSI